MKTKLLIAVSFLIATAVGGFVMMRSQSSSSKPTVLTPMTKTTPPPQSPEHVAHSRVPKFQSVADVRDLPPTLSPTQFIGKQREAYEVARRIPATLAQLPCYCYCDQSFGHKSLLTCFVDNHASQCAVCVDEALLAYSLEKEQKLSPDQIRKLIIEKYSREL